MAVNATFRVRRGTAAQWNIADGANDLILAPGRIGFEMDTYKFKIGDGLKNWKSLPYCGRDLLDIPFDGATYNILMLNPAWVDDGSQTDPDSGGRPRMIPVTNAFDALVAIDDRIDMLEAHLIESPDESIEIIPSTSGNGLQLKTNAGIIPYTPGSGIWLAGTKENPAWVDDGSQTDPDTNGEARFIPVTIADTFNAIATVIGDPALLAPTGNLVKIINDLYTLEQLESDDESIVIDRTDPDKVDLSVDIEATKYMNPDLPMIPFAGAMLKFLNDNKINLTYDDGAGNIRVFNNATGVQNFEGTAGKWSFDPLNGGITIEQPDGTGQQNGGGALSTTNTDASWSMFGTYKIGEAPSVLTNKDGTTTNLEVRAQITSRDSTNNGVRLLVLTNNKIYVKVGTDNNVSYLQEIGMGQGGAGGEVVFQIPNSPDGQIIVPISNFVKTFTMVGATGAVTVTDTGYGDVGTMVTFMSAENNGTYFSAVKEATGIVIANDGTNATVQYTINVKANTTSSAGTVAQIINVDGEITIDSEDDQGDTSSMTVSQDNEVAVFEQNQGGDDTLLGLKAGVAVYEKVAPATYLEPTNTEVARGLDLMTIIALRSTLTTNDKTSIVAAINEVNSKATSAMSLVGWAGYLADTTATMNTIVGYDLAFCFNFQTLSWFYYSTVTTSWIALPIGWAKGVDDIVRTQSELPVTGDWDGFTIGVLGDNTIHQWDAGAAQWNDITATWTAPNDDPGDQYLIRSFWGTWQGDTFTGAPNAVLTKTAVGWTYIVNIQTDFSDLKDTDWT